ncbi:phospholipase [Bacillus niameyensis]|uniref:phospholipase n=1 Tax=Bacillus niameyensis TaxID=1522308 RepID=UPI000A037BA9|nr:phospholipase [Bacillus niameyensis]
MLYRKGISRRTQSRCIFPGYNWCGPGCSGPGAPINDVDACCMRHDLCLRRNIDPCICDFAFMDCLRPKMSRPTPDGRHASLMYGAMRLRTSFRCR